jgi:hypothetical protein
MAEAAATLTHADSVHAYRERYDLAILALALHRLGQSEKARETLARLREVMKNREPAEDPVAQAFLREAEMIELDHVFPADPFAP